MYYKKRKMAGNQNQENDSADLSHQLCFVHRVADLPLVSASIDQFLTYYEKAKKMNKLVDSSLNLAENGVKYAAGKIQPLRRIFDGPIVVANKIACYQLETLEAWYPSIHITPDELLESGKIYYNKSYVKTGVDTTQGIITYGQQKVHNSKELIREQAFNAYGYVQAIFYAVDVVKHSAYGILEKPLTKLTTAQAQAVALLREIRTSAAKYGKQPDVALLVMVQNMATTFVAFSDIVSKYSSALAPEILQKNVVLAVQYAHEMSDVFNEATTLGELRDDVIKEAKEKFAFIQSVFSTIIDRLVVYPPMSWLATVTQTTNGILGKSFPNGVVINGIKKNE